MAFEFELPDIGEGVVEGEIVKWLVHVGDAIDVDQPMVEVMTDKATVVIPSPRRGVVRACNGREGEIVKVHSTLIVIDEEGAPKTPAALDTRSSPPSSTPKDEGARVTVSSMPERVLAAPATRRLARELGLALANIPGTGPAGRVTAEDVRRASALPHQPVSTSLDVRAPMEPTSSARASSTPILVAEISEPTARPLALEADAAHDVRIHARGLRRRIWEHMAESKARAAHFTFVEECDATELVALRDRFNRQLGNEGQKLSYLPFIIKAVIASLQRFPALNGHVDEEQMAFVERRDHHIGIAVASERGLIVPVIRHAGRRSLLGLRDEIERLADAVRSNRLSPSDLGASTFTITSLGKEGGIFATPIINYPEVAIMGVHKMVKRPVVADDDRIVVRSMMNLSLSFDHRLIDGHVGAAFANTVIRLLENPDRLLMAMA